MDFVLAILVALNVFFGGIMLGKGTGFLSALSFSSAAFCLCSFIKVVSQ